MLIRHLIPYIKFATAWIIMLLCENKMPWKSFKKLAKNNETPPRYDLHLNSETLSALVSVIAPSPC